MKKLIILLATILAITISSGLSLAGEVGLEKGDYTVEQLLGKEVSDLEGKHVGIIRDFNLNSITGEINYVILGKSMLGIGEDKFAVPLEALKIRNVEGGTNVTLIVSELMVITAPSFDTAESAEKFKEILLNHYCAVPELDDEFNVIGRC